MINLCRDNLLLHTALNGYQKVHLLRVYLVPIFYIGTQERETSFSNFSVNCQRNQWAESYRRKLSKNDLAVSPSVYDNEVFIPRRVFQILEK